MFRVAAAAVAFLILTGASYADDTERAKPGTAGEVRTQSHDFMIQDRTYTIALTVGDDFAQYTLSRGAQTLVDRTFETVDAEAFGTAIDEFVAALSQDENLVTWYPQSSASELVSMEFTSIAGGSNLTAEEGLAPQPFNSPSQGTPFSGAATSFKSAKPVEENGARDDMVDLDQISNLLLHLSYKKLTEEPAN